MEPVKKHRIDIIDTVQHDIITTVHFMLVKPLESLSTHPPKSAATLHLGFLNYSPSHNKYLWEISDVLLVYLITCGLRQHLCLMDGPDIGDWVFPSLGLARGTGRTLQWDIYGYELLGLSTQLRFLQRRTRGSISGQSAAPEQCQPSACQKEVLQRG